MVIKVLLNVVHRLVISNFMLMVILREWISLKIYYLLSPCSSNFHCCQTVGEDAPVSASSA